MNNIDISFSIMIFVCGLVFGSLPMWAYLSRKVDLQKEVADYWREEAIDYSDRYFEKFELAEANAKEANYWSNKYLQQVKVGK